MDLFSIQYLTDEQIIHFRENRGQYHNEINQEWFKRHKINYPYVVNDGGVIVDCKEQVFLGDREVSEEVVEQANVIRRTRGISR